MKVYRITLSHFADKLFAAGKAARWNSNGVFMIYSASSRALACLENLVHRGGEGLDNHFSCMIIDIPDELSILSLDEELLTDDWKDYQNQRMTRYLGDEWVRELSTPVLKVPSAIIPEECNYLMNPAHPEFQKIKLVQIDPFSFDPRLNEPYSFTTG